MSKLVKADQTLANLVHEFGSLAEKYCRAEEALNAGQSLDVHRRDVDSMYSISAGMCLLVAVKRDFIRSVDSAVWNLFDSRTNRIDNHIREYSKLQDSRKELADPSLSRADSLGYGNCFSPSEVASYYFAAEPSAPLEPIDLDALRRKAESHLREITQLKARLELESDLDLTSDEGQSLLMWTWLAFVRLELVPNHVSEFKPDWQERLMPPEFFVTFGAKDSGQRNRPRSLFEKTLGDTKDDRSRYCVASRANIYATACRVMAKMLKAEWDRRHAENGQLQTSVQGNNADGGADSTSAPKLEATTTSETQKLPPESQQLAYMAYDYAREKEGNPKLTQQEAYDFWNDPKRGLAAEDRDEYPQLKGYVLGKISSYKTNLSKAANHPAINRPRYGKRKRHRTGQKRQNGRNMIGEDGK